MNRMKQTVLERPTEIWFQTNFDGDLWEAETGLIINTAALEEREAFLTVSRIPSAVSFGADQESQASA